MGVVFHTPWTHCAAALERTDWQSLPSQICCAHFFVYEHERKPPSTEQGLSGAGCEAGQPRASAPPAGGQSLVATHTLD